MRERERERERDRERERACVRNHLSLDKCLIIALALPLHVITRTHKGGREVKANHLVEVTRKLERMPSCLGAGLGG